MRLFGQKKIRLKRMVKEAFDNLPSGVCFFDNSGIVILCNRQMHHLVFSLTGRDLQNLDELKALIDGKPERGWKKGGVFLCEDGSAWRFSEEKVTTGDGSSYTQIVASNVTRLYQIQTELEQENQRLTEAGERLRRLSANMVAVIREEEILSMKMRVHDDIGRSVIATRQLLRQNLPTWELDLTAWKNAIRLFQRDNESTEEKDAFTQLIEAARGIGIQIELDGKLPEHDAAYLFIVAMRECATNAARHAEARTLFVTITEQEDAATARITNDGRPPRGEITEGGGLGSLRSRVEKSGGTMIVRCTPSFELTVSIPLAKEDAL